MHCFFFCSVCIYIHKNTRSMRLKHWLHWLGQKIRCEVFQLVCVGEKNATKRCSFGFGLVSW